MAARSSWKGFLKLSLVSVPVRGYSASNSAGSIRLNQLHAECHSRIKYQKTCPIHGPVPKEEIVSAYEYAKGQYVVIDQSELDELWTEQERAITIDAIVKPQTIDPVYFTDRTYYLLPDGAVGQKPFALIQECMAKDELEAVARVVLFGHEEIVLVRAVENLLAITALKYDAEVTHASSLSEELGKAEFDQEEISLTKTLLKAFVRKNFSIAKYKDHYIEKLTELIEAKVEGRELVKPPATEEPRVINLMDALKRSVAQARTTDEPESKVKPASRKLAPSSKRSKPVARASRKSG